MGNFSLVDLDKIQETQPKRWNLELFCQKSVVSFRMWGRSVIPIRIWVVPVYHCGFAAFRVFRAGVFGKENFHPGYRDTEPRCYRSQKTEISVTGPARLFIMQMSGEARSRKPITTCYPYPTWLSLRSLLSHVHFCLGLSGTRLCSTVSVACLLIVLFTEA